MLKVITLTGPSGSGKSTAIRYFLNNAKKKFFPKVIAKYSTRLKRNEDGFEIKAGYHTLPENCDLVYEQYGVRYGLVLQEIYDSLSKGESPIVILNDVRAVEDIRSLLNGLVKSIFIYRSDPNIKQTKSLAKKRGIDIVEADRRHQKAMAIYRIYIENIHLFDHVIINRYTRRELSTQVKKIVSSIKFDKHWPLQRK